MENFISILLICQIFSSFLCFLSLFFKKYQKSIILYCSIIVSCIALFLPIFLWFYQQKASFQTEIETKFWFCVFTMCLGWIFSIKRNDFLILLICNVICTIFSISNLFSIGQFQQEMPPALQSPWFIPHVCTYMIAYSLLGFNAICSIISLFKTNFTFNFQIKIIKIGLYCLFSALLMGALWAKTIWANFWSWDTKEVFALFSVVLYIFILFNFNNQNKFSHILNVFAFICLLFTWFGIKYLTYLNQSLHIYG